MATTETPMLEDVGRWAEAFLRPTVLVEFAALAACLGLAWSLVSLLQRGLHRGDPRSILFGTRIVDGALFPLALLSLAYVARTVLLQWVPLAVFKVTRKCSLSSFTVSPLTTTVKVPWVWPMAMLWPLTLRAT